MEGFKNLNSYILATIIYDLTVEFCRWLIDKKSRTYDQMEQAAHSGKQNIAEGYTVQSLESYIKLVGVAEGSIKELAADYEDFLDKEKCKFGIKIIHELGLLGNLGQFGLNSTSPIPQTSLTTQKKLLICF